MSRIFISHSSLDNDRATEVHRWLTENGWDDVFLDFHPDRGIEAGARWQEALRQATDRCEAVLFLISENWLASPHCLGEFYYAKHLGKRIFPILVGPVAFDHLPREISAEFQIVDLVSDEHVFQRLHDGLTRAGLDGSTFTVPEARKLRPKGQGPYPGLQPLTETDPAIFFGREAHIVRGLDRLRSLRDQGVARMMVILGASGAGKSSFLRAGLWPRLERDRRAFLVLPTVRPSRAVLSGEQGLYRSLETAIAAASAEQDLPATRGALRERIEGRNGLAEVVNALSEAARGPLAEETTASAPTVVLPIDQGEELFNADSGGEAARFMDLLADTLADKTHLLVIIAIRSDAFPLLQNEVRLLEVSKDTMDLPAMSAANYRAVIKGPADLVGLTLEPALLEALLSDVGGAGGADALPLLAFTLERLYAEYGDDDLTLEEYRKLGGLGGAIEVAVDDVLAAAREDRRLPDSDVDLLPLLRSAFIPHLARINEAGEYVRRQATAEEIPEESRPLVDLLVEQRLLVRDRAIDNGDNNKETIEVAHEALLREWPQLARWLNEQREFLTWRSQLEAARALWESLPNGARAPALLMGRALTIAEGWLATRAQDLPAADTDFIRASVEAHEKATRRRQRTRQAVMAAMALLTVGAVAGGILAWQQSEEAIQERDRAKKLASRVFSLFSQKMARRSTKSFQEKKYQEALRYALIPIQKNTKKIKNVHTEIISILIRIKAKLPMKIGKSDKDFVTYAAFVPQKPQVIVATGPLVRVFDLRSTEPIVRLHGHTDGVVHAAFSPDGARFVTASRYGSVRLWNSKSGAIVASIKGHTGTIVEAVFTPDGRRLLTASEDGTARVWDARTGFPLAVLKGHKAALVSAAISPTGRLAATSSLDKTVAIWSVKTGQILYRFKLGGVPKVQFLSRILVSALVRDRKSGPTIRIWDTNEGRLIASANGKHPLIFQLIAQVFERKQIEGPSDGEMVWGRNLIVGPDLLSWVLSEKVRYTREMAD